LWNSPGAGTCALGRPDEDQWLPGGSDVFAQAIADFAEAYAEQTKRDHAALVAAIKEGRVQAESDI